LRKRDGVSVHPYSAVNWDFVDPATPGGPFLRSINGIRAVMRSRGDGDSGVYVTEFGFAHCPAMPCVSAEQAGLWLAKSFKVAARLPYVRALTAFALSDYGADPKGEFAGWMMRSGIVGTPAYSDVRRTLKRLRLRDCRGAAGGPDAAAADGGAAGGARRARRGRGAHPGLEESEHRVPLPGPQQRPSGSEAGRPQPDAKATVGRVCVHRGLFSRFAHR
jgi:hypothetical protein